MKTTRPRKGSAEKELEALGSVAADPLSAPALDALKAAAASAHAIVVARAARLAEEHGVEAIVPDLEQAFHRFLAHPRPKDPSCQAKVALLNALDRLESRDPSPFLAAVRCIQLEPSYLRPSDTAGPVRARGILGLARLAHDDVAVIAGDLLTDSDAPVRTAAAEAVEANGQRVGAGLLILKMNVGDEDPMVILACLEGVLTLAPEAGLPLAQKMLFDDLGGQQDIAAVALGRSRREEALDLLLELFASLSPVHRDLAIRGIGYHRSPRALAMLLKTVAESEARVAKAAVTALASRTFERDLRERVVAASNQNQKVRLDAAINEAFSAH
jgi:hypothetical protein